MDAFETLYERILTSFIDWQFVPERFGAAQPVTIPMLFALFEFMVHNTYRLAFGHRIKVGKWRL